jgi:HEAT repeat protein
VVGLLIVVLGLPALLLVRAPRETWSKGRRLSAWLEEVPASVLEKGVDPATGVQEALREMAPDCLPYMLEMMRARDSRWRHRADLLLSKQNWIAFRLEPRPAYKTRWAAVRGFALLGSNAQPAVAGLARLLRNPDTSSQAACALAFIGTEDATITLEKGLANPNVLVRQAVILPLGLPVPAADKLVPALVQRLQDPDALVRENAARVLGSIQSAPNLAVPALAARLRDRSTDVRRTAANSLSLFGAEARDARAALLEALRAGDPTYCRAVERALNSLGKPDDPSPDHAAP